METYMGKASNVIWSKDYSEKKSFSKSFPQPLDGVLEFLFDG
jgi:hypothetical protein